MGDVETAQLAAVLDHRDGELPGELGAVGERELLAVRRGEGQYAKRVQGMQTVKQRPGSDEGAVRDEKTTAERERLQFPAVVENGQQTVVGELPASV